MDDATRDTTYDWSAFRKELADILKQDPRSEECKHAIKTIKEMRSVIKEWINMEKVEVCMRALSCSSDVMHYDIVLDMPKFRFIHKWCRVHIPFTGFPLVIFNANTRIVCQQEDQLDKCLLEYISKEKQILVTLDICGW